MVTSKAVKASKSMTTVLLGTVEPKKGSVRFNAADNLVDPLLSSAYVNKAAALKAGVNMDDAKGIEVTVKVLY